MPKFDDDFMYKLYRGCLLPVLIAAVILIILFAILLLSGSLHNTY